MKRIIQQHLDMGYPELVTNSVELTPSDHAKDTWREQWGQKQNSSELKVRVVAYEGLIIIEPKDPENNVGKDFGWIPMGQTRIGSVLCDTKKRLGVSHQAFELMRKIQVGRDCIGDIDWFACDDGTYAFSWFGPIYRVINLETSIAARSFHIIDKLLETCTLISNDVPAEAVELIDRLGRSVVTWKDQAGINLPEETLGTEFGG
jgi:hypothetical protein